MAKMIEQVTYNERAREILKLHDAGLSRKEIAERLGYKLSYLSPRIKDALANREYLSQKVDFDGLQVRTMNSLNGNGIHTNEELEIAIRDGRIFPDSGWKNFGRKCVEDIARFAKDVLGIEDASKMLRLETGALEMKWTKNKPSEDGLYWLKMDGDKPTVVNVYDCHEKDKDFGPMVSLIGTDWDKSVHELTSKYACEWFGPIAPPRYP